MTNLRKPLSRVTADIIHEAGKNREIVVHLGLRTIAVRAKGCKTAYEATYKDLYSWCVKMEVRHKAREKAKAKKKKRQASKARGSRAAGVSQGKSF
jgi:hypothetical protein